MDIKWAEDDRPYPKTIKCRGGWFAVERKGELGSGPWRNEEAAEFALKGEFTEANRINHILAALKANQESRSGKDTSIPSANR